MPQAGHLGRRQDRVDGRRALKGQRLPQVARLHNEQVAALCAGHQALALACAGAALQAGQMFTLHSGFACSACTLGDAAKSEACMRSLCVWHCRLPESHPACILAKTECVRHAHGPADAAEQAR